MTPPTISPADQAECVRLVLELGEMWLEYNRTGVGAAPYIETRRDLEAFAVALATKVREHGHG
jgi:hypothetical protein